jgi:hypothetical protein
LVYSLFGGITEKHIVFPLKNLDLRSKKGIDLFFSEQLSLKKSKTAVNLNYQKINKE